MKLVINEFNPRHVDFQKNPENIIALNDIPEYRV